MTFGTGRCTGVDPRQVVTRDDFADFLRATLDDFWMTGQSEWENGTLERFLDGLSAVAYTPMTSRSKQDQEQASWGLFAELVQAATGYE